MEAFNGTSAAAAMVFGVVALMLEANPNLGWRDVHEILAYSARHVGSAVGTAATGAELPSTSGTASWLWNDATDWNGGGLHFSNDYGFGLIDAKAAVRLAETWEKSSTSANDTSNFQDLLNATVTIAEGAGSSFSAFEGTAIRAEHVTVDISFTATGLTNKGDLLAYLVSPSGTESLIFSGVGGTGSFTSDRWTFSSNAFRGEESGGTWTVRLVDRDSNVTSPIEIDDIDLRVLGAPPTDDDLIILTGEFSAHAGLAGHSTGFAGGTGVNRLNAAAVSSNSTVNLAANTGTIDGVAITNPNIDRVRTGDGADTVTGDGVSSFVDAARGPTRSISRAPPAPRPASRSISGQGSTTSSRRASAPAPSMRSRP